MDPSLAMVPPDPQEVQETRIDPAMGAAPTPSALPPVKSGGRAAKPISMTVRRRQPDKPDPGDPETWGKVQRNATCPCGSGKKYKHCHGKAA